MDDCSARSMALGAMVAAAMVDVLTVVENSASKMMGNTDRAFYSLFPLLMN